MLKIILNQYRCIPVWLFVCTSRMKMIIVDDLHRYKELDQINDHDYIAFCKLLINKFEFRTQISYRLSSDSKIKGFISRILFKGQAALYITTKDIGSGLYIQHGFATIISAKQIGRNAYINQQVTIGYNGMNNPIIGDGVRICAGAKIVGGITVGDRSIIGANAVVVKDVPSDVTMGGVPAYVIRRHDNA